MVAHTLADITTWFGEATANTDRTTLLSKLAILELCGWIEFELDEIVRHAELGRLNDADWVEKNVVSTTYGLHYTKHFRPMLAKVAGEIFVRRIEQEMENLFPGELDRLKNLLGGLWDLRCKLAHGHVGSVVAQQATYQSPSLSVQQHVTVVALLGKYRSAVDAALAPI